MSDEDRMIAMRSIEAMYGILAHVKARQNIGLIELNLSGGLGRDSHLTLPYDQGRAAAHDVQYEIERRISKDLAETILKVWPN
jgi:hypothetical protein